MKFKQFNGHFVATLIFVLIIVSVLIILLTLQRTRRQKVLEPFSSGCTFIYKPHGTGCSSSHWKYFGNDNPNNIRGYTMLYPNNNGEYIMPQMNDRGGIFEVLCNPLTITAIYDHGKQVSITSKNIPSYGLKSLFFDSKVGYVYLLSTTLNVSNHQGLNIDLFNNVISSNRMFLMTKNSGKWTKSLGFQAGASAQLNKMNFYAGHLKVPSSNFYTFRVLADDHVLMEIYIGNKWERACYMFGPTAMHETQYNNRTPDKAFIGTYNLIAGTVYPFRIFHLNEGGYFQLSPQWNIGNSSYVVIPQGQFSIPDNPEDIPHEWYTPPPQCKADDSGSIKTIKNLVLGVPSVANANFRQLSNKIYVYTPLDSLNGIFDLPIPTNISMVQLNVKSSTTRPETITLQSAATYDGNFDTSRTLEFPCYSNNTINIIPSPVKTSRIRIQSAIGISSWLQNVSIGLSETEYENISRTDNYVQLGLSNGDKFMIRTSLLLNNTGGFPVSLSSNIKCSQILVPSTYELWTNSERKVTTRGFPTDTYNITPTSDLRIMLQDKRVSTYNYVVCASPSIIQQLSSTVAANIIKSHVLKILLNADPTEHISIHDDLLYFTRNTISKLPVYDHQSILSMCDTYVKPKNIKVTLDAVPDGYSWSFFDEKGTVLDIGAVDKEVMFVTCFKTSDTSSDVPGIYKIIKSSSNQWFLKVYDDESFTFVDIPALPNTFPTTTGNSTMPIHIIGSDITNCILTGAQNEIFHFRHYFVDRNVERKTSTTNKSIYQIQFLDLTANYVPALNANSKGFNLEPRNSDYILRVNRMVMIDGFTNTNIDDTNLDGLNFFIVKIYDGMGNQVHYYRLRRIVTQNKDIMEWNMTMLTVDNPHLVMIKNALPDFDEKIYQQTPKLHEILQDEQPVFTLQFYYLKPAM